ncbi:unnamed protein product, partial [Closterium sp. NIES-54]
WMQDARHKGSLPTPIWALRCLEQLCMLLTASHPLHQPNQVPRSSSSAGAATLSQHPQQQSLAPLWQSMWGEVTAALPALPHSLVEPCLSLLSTLLQAGVLQDVTPPREMLALPQFKEGAAPTSATLQFAASLLSNTTFQRQEAALLALNPAATSPLSTARVALLQWLLAGMANEAHGPSLSPSDSEPSHPITLRTALHRTHRPPDPSLLAAALCAAVTGEAPCFRISTAAVAASLAAAPGAAAAWSCHSPCPVPTSFHRDWWFPLHEDVRDMEPALPHLDRSPHCLVAAAAGAAGAAACAPRTALVRGVPHSPAAAAAPASPPQWLAAFQNRDKHTPPSLASSPYSPPSTNLTLSRSLLDASRVLPLSQAALSALASLTRSPSSAEGDGGGGEGVVGGRPGGRAGGRAGGEGAGGLGRGPGGEGEWVEGRGSAGSSEEGSGGGGGGGMGASSLWVAAVGLHCCRLLSCCSFTRTLPRDLLSGGLLEKQSLQSAITALASSPSISPTGSLDPPSFPLIRDLLSILPRTPASLPLLSAMLRLATTSFTTVAEAAAAAAAGAGGGATGGCEAAVSALSLPPASAVTFATRSHLDDDFDDDWEFQQPSASTTGLHAGHSGLQSAGGRGGRGGARGRLGGMLGPRSGAVGPSFQFQQQQVIELDEEGGEEAEARIFDNDLDAPGVLPSQAPLVRSRHTQSAWRDGAGGSGAAASAARAAAAAAAAGAGAGGAGGGGSATAAEVAEGAVCVVGWVAEFLPAAACSEVASLLQLNEGSEVRAGQGARDRGQETGGKGQVTGGKGQVTGGRGQGTGDRGQGAGDRGQGAGGRGQGTGDRGQGIGGRGQGTGDRGQGTWDRGQGTGVRGQWAVIACPTATAACRPATPSFPHFTPVSPPIQIAGLESHASTSTTLHSHRQHLLCLTATPFISPLHPLVPSSPSQLAALESRASTTLHSHQQHLLHLTAITARRLAAHRGGTLPPPLLPDEGVEDLGAAEERMEGVGSMVAWTDAWGGGADTATASDTDVNQVRGGAGERWRR